jgi:chromate transporter
VSGAGSGEPARLTELARVFLKLGTVAFGGPAAHIAMMEEEVVRRRGWLTEPEFLDYLGATNLIPGPNSTELAIHVGHARAGWRGLLVAVGFVTAGSTGAVVATVGIFRPAFVFVALSGPLVPRLRRSPTAGAVLDGVNVGALALMALATWQLARSAIVGLPTSLVGLVALLLLIRFRINSAWLVLGGAVVGLLLRP